MKEGSSQQPILLKKKERWEDLGCGAAGPERKSKKTCGGSKKVALSALAQHGGGKYIRSRKVVLPKTLTSGKKEGGGFPSTQTLPRTPEKASILKLKGGLSTRSLPISKRAVKGGDEKTLAKMEKGGVKREGRDQGESFLEAPLVRKVNTKREEGCKEEESRSKRYPLREGERPKRGAYSKIWKTPKGEETVPSERENFGGELLGGALVKAARKRFSEKSGKAEGETEKRGEARMRKGGRVGCAKSHQQERSEENI